MDDMMDFMMGVDKKNEIFNLWYEVTFLRLVVNHVLVSNPSLAECLSEEAMAACKFNAQQIVQERFPVIKIDFSEPSPEQIEKKKKHLDNLHIFNKVMGFASPNEHQKEDLACTPVIPSQEPDAPLSPLSGT